MPDHSPLKTPGEMIRFALRFFGWMLGFMGAFCLFINLFPLATGGEISFAVLVAGAGMLTAGVAIFRVSGRFGSLLDERLQGVLLNRESTRNDTVDGNTELDAGPSASPGSGIGRKAVYRKSADAPGDPADSHLAQKAYRIGDRNRFIVSRKRSMTKAHYAIGVVFLIIAFFYSNGHHAVMEDGSWEIDFISLIMLLLGLANVIVAGLNRHVEIDRGEGWVKHGWKWLCFRFANRFPLYQFDHVLIRRLASYESVDASIWQPVGADWEVLLRGAESLNLIYFDKVSDARELAQRVADDTGFVVKEET
jgi:hypothetical protein